MKVGSMSNSRPGRKTMSIGEAAKHLGISRGVAYEAAHLFLDSAGAEGLPVLRLGRRLVVPVARLEQLLGCNVEHEECGDVPDVVSLREASAGQWHTQTLAPTGTG
jgi:transposase